MAGRNRKSVTMIARLASVLIANGVLFVLPLAQAQGVVDADADGLNDLLDNCVQTANADQIDSNGDFFGNACDADLNDDGIINAIDLGIFKTLFFSADADADFNGDRVVNSIDLGMLKQMFFLPPGPSGVAASNVDITLVPVFTGVSWNAPIAMRQAPGNPDRWFVLERTGEIISVGADDNADDAWEVIDIPGVDTEFEGGALGFDFHPDFENNGYLYVSYTADGGPLVSRIARFETSVNGAGRLVGDVASQQIVLSVQQPYANHNGGNLLFGPDGYLFWGLGDGGSGGDPLNNGQQTSTLLGAMLRIDVNVTQAEIDAGTFYRIPGDNPFKDNACNLDGCEEIFAWGLRNPWRFSFDRQTGDLWAGDVGQISREEIDIVTNGGNYGWRCREGNLAYSSSAGCPPLSEFTPPVHDYPRSVGNSVTGGYVYRGSDIANFGGMYVFADYGAGEIFGIYNQSYAGVLLNTSLPITSFAESLDGELYLTYFSFSSGGIRRIAAAP